LLQAQLQSQDDLQSWQGGEPETGVVAYIRRTPLFHVEFAKA
jgi:hypothetical protein